MHAKLEERIARVEALLAERLYLRGTLREKLAGARGRLPRRALREAEELLEVRARIGNPKTARVLDTRRVRQVCDRLERHLHAIPEGKYRRRAWSATLGLAALRVLIVVAATLGFLLWRHAA